MADTNKPQDESTEQQGGWWGSWISSAKSKSAEVYSMVKKDLDEISSAVKSEASQVYSATSSAIEKTLKLDEPESTANVMKKSFSTFLDQVNTVLNPQPDDEDTEVILSTGDTTMLTTYKRELEALQRLDATFLVPADSAEFDAWKSTLEGSELTTTPASIERRLRSEPLLAEQHSKLVPSAIDENTFWERYLFRVALLQDRLAAAVRQGNTLAGLPQTNDPVLSHLPLQIDTTETSQPRSADRTPLSSQKSSPLKTPSLSKSVSKSTSLAVEPSLSEDLDEGVAWEEEDFASDVELTEEQQTLLLQEYEKEIATKKQIKTTLSKDLTNNNKQNQSPTKQNHSPTKQNHSPTKQNHSPTKQNQSPAKQNQSKSKQNVTSNKKVEKIEPLLNKADSKSKKSVVNIKPTSNANEKSDVCGNNLIEDHFKEETKAKDDASSHSDESWEKEFEIEES